MFLFKQYCLQFCGTELWFGGGKCNGSLKQFAVGYHKALKKILGLSYHESNHYACEQAQIFTFEHLLFWIKVNFWLRLQKSTCNFINKTKNFLCVSSVLIGELSSSASIKYDISDLLDNDRDAILSRIWYIQNHEEPLR